MTEHPKINYLISEFQKSPIRDCSFLEKMNGMITIINAWGDYTPAEQKILIESIESNKN